MTEKQSEDNRKVEFFGAMEGTLPHMEIRKTPEVSINIISIKGRGGILGTLGTINLNRLPNETNKALAERAGQLLSENIFKELERIEPDPVQIESMHKDRVMRLKEALVAIFKSHRHE